MRLGAHRCLLVAGSLAEKLYGAPFVYERHRHRYELNNDYREQLSKLGLHCSGLSPDYRLVEIIEIPSHPFFIATQFHPEFLSRPNRAHPLFRGLIAAALERDHRLYKAPGQQSKDAVVTNNCLTTGDDSAAHTRGNIQTVEALEL
jgi:CTP synthase